MGKKRDCKKTTPSSVKGLLWSPESGQVLVLWKLHGNELSPDLPGGSPEGREKVSATLAREVLEETGIELGRASFPRRERDGRVLVVGVLALNGSQLCLSDEHHGAMLVPLGQVTDYFTKTPWCTLVAAAVQDITKGRVPMAA
ncbi:MAG: NUDIX domain-containing protein [Candidatus Saccharimonadales bacterium]|jgi:8-oxo-dGTP pyrophosphatase MutT (NUDIX family)|nr:NUDIX hydrolase [Candidatus Saccharibacteria bacterium]